MTIPRQLDAATVSTAEASWALVHRVQSGDPTAVAELYERYHDVVFRFVYFRVGNRPLAEDLAQDTWFRALRRIDSFTWRGSDFGAVLVTIARNLVADHFKSSRHRLEVLTGETHPFEKPDEDLRAHPDLALLDYLGNRELLTAVKELNPEQQLCIVLRFLRGYSVAETAAEMHKHQGAIKALQGRAVRTLARMLPEGLAAWQA